MVIPADPAGPGCRSSPPPTGGVGGALCRSRSGHYYQGPANTENRGSAGPGVQVPGFSGVWMGVGTGEGRVQEHSVSEDSFSQTHRLGGLCKSHRSRASGLPATCLRGSPWSGPGHRACLPDFQGSRPLPLPPAAPHRRRQAQHALSEGPGDRLRAPPANVSGQAPPTPRPTSGGGGEHRCSQVQGWGRGGARRWTRAGLPEAS